MIDVAAQNGYLATTLRIMQLSQMLNLGQWVGSDPFYSLPFSNAMLVHALRFFLTKKDTEYHILFSVLLFSTCSTGLFCVIVFPFLFRTNRNISPTLPELAMYASQHPGNLSHLRSVIAPQYKNEPTSKTAEIKVTFVTYFTFFLTVEKSRQDDVSM